VHYQKGPKQAGSFSDWLLVPVPANCGGRNPQSAAIRNAPQSDSIPNPQSPIRKRKTGTPA
jgi:hypothetical protein